MIKLLLLILLFLRGESASLPNIFFVVVDDFGWGTLRKKKKRFTFLRKNQRFTFRTGDSGWHREDPEVITPTMNELVKNGIELDRHYVHPMCTPSRSSLQSGRLPVHILTQLVGPCDKNGAIPRNITGIAAKLKTAGYATHHVGKWDAGMVYVSALSLSLSFSLFSHTQTHSLNTHTHTHTRQAQ